MHYKVWDEIVYSFSNFKRCICWSLEMDKQFHPTPYRTRNYVSKLGCKVNPYQWKGLLKLYIMLRSSSGSNSQLEKLCDEIQRLMLCLWLRDMYLQGFTITSPFSHVLSIPRNNTLPRLCIWTHLLRGYLTRLRFHPREFILSTSFTYNTPLTIDKFDLILM